MRIRDKALGGTIAALALVACLATPAFAQGNDVDFGDDSSEWANDGECDDPRFSGTGMAAELEEVDTLKDATDCRTAFEAGSVTLAEEPAEDVAAEDDATSEEDVAAEEAPVAPPPVAEAEDDTEAEPAAAEETAAAPEIDFGDDSSSWANDGECDDPRFAGTGMAVEVEEVDTLKDATDCRTAFEAGTITLAGDDVAATEGTETTVTAAIDFGDDSSEWARDEECDDPRFVGEAMASSLDDINIGKDATDCQAAYDAGTVTYADNQTDPGQPAQDPAATQMLTALANRIDFGDDSGDYPNDGECDDPDFIGSGMAAQPVDSDRLGDASDCKAAFIAGTVSYKGASSMPAAFDYGTDFSKWANDGECDDWRFTGTGMSKKLYSEDVLGDATDCRALETAGDITVKSVYQPSYALGAPYDSSGIDFGTDSSSYSNDQVCDDPRFEGPGVASAVYESDRLADATDCRTAFESGTVALRDGEA